MKLVEFQKQKSKSKRHVWFDFESWIRYKSLHPSNKYTSLIKEILIFVYIFILIWMCCQKPNYTFILKLKKIATFCNRFEKKNGF